MDGHNVYREELANKYRDIFKNAEEWPKWAVKKLSNPSEVIRPATPFVGENYDRTGLIVYASAENLLGYNGYLDNDDTAIERRYNSDEDKTKPFPNIHCNPIYSGPLLVVAAYILKRLNRCIALSNPRDFLSNIAVDNFSKFTKVPKKNGENDDPAGDIDFLRHSFKYIEADLSVLKPKIIILTERTHRLFPEVRELIKRYVPSCLCVPICQMGARNINRKNLISKHSKRQEGEVDKILLEWHKKITDKSIIEAFFSVYNYLDWVLEEKCGIPLPAPS